MKNLLSILALVVALASLALTWFNRPAAQPLRPAKDDALRTLCDTRMFSANYTLPAAEPYAALCMLEFEDGQLVHRSGGFMVMNIKKHLGPYALQFLWNKDGRMIFQYAWQKSGGGSGYCQFTEENPFWGKLPVCFGNSDPKTPFAYDGYTILGFATSLLSYNPQNTNWSDRNFLSELQNKKYVGAVALKTFKTEEECDAFAKEVVKVSLEWKMPPAASAQSAPKREARNINLGDSWPKPETPHAVITVRKDGKFELGGRVLEMHPLREELVKLRALSPDCEVSLRCEEGVPFDDFKKLLEQCKYTGLAKVSVETIAPAPQPAAPQPAATPAPSAN